MFVSISNFNSSLVEEVEHLMLLALPRPSWMICENPSIGMTLLAKRYMGQVLLSVSPELEQLML